MTQKTTSPRPGDAQPDATVYAGTSPDSGLPLFTAPTDVFMTVDFADATRYLNGMNKAKANGHDDWRMPTKGELGVLFNNHAAIGGFTGGDPSTYHYYWSSTASEKAKDSRVFARRLSDLDEADHYSMRDFAILRPVR